MMRNLFLGLSPVIFVLLLVGCGGQVSDSAAERELVARAPDLIGPAEHYQASVDGISLKSAEAIRLVGIGVRPDPNLVVDPLVLNLRGVRYQLRPFRVTELASATFSGRISESALNAYLQKQNRLTTGTIRNIRVELQRELVKVSASVPVVGVEVPFSTTGRLRVTDGLRVNYEPQALQVVGITIPAEVLKLLAGMVNPIADLSGLRFTPQIEHITIERGALVIDGTAELRNYLHPDSREI